MQENHALLWQLLGLCQQINWAFFPFFPAFFFFFCLSSSVSILLLLKMKKIFITVLWLNISWFANHVKYLCEGGVMISVLGSSMIWKTHGKKKCIVRENMFLKKKWKKNALFITLHEEKHHMPKWYSMCIIVLNGTVLS